MSQTTRAAIETPTEPVSADDAGGDGACEPDGLEGGLQFGRAWHRYRYCYRRPGPIRVLVAGCETGRSSVLAARLNPGSSVLGVEASAGAVAAARERAAGTDVAAALEFRAHDPSEPLSDDWGRFDFVVCRDRLARAADPDRLLANLAQALNPEGLLLVTTPSQSTRQVAGAFRGAVETLLPPGAGADQRAEVGLELFLGLRPDHPIRAHAARTRHDPAGPGEAARAVAAFLAGRHDWSLEQAAALFDAAGLQFLYAATPWRWRPDRVFDPDAPPGRLADLVAGLEPGPLGRLIDALDPTILDDSYHLYACPAGYRPTVPDWPVTRFRDPSRFERLVPRLIHLSGPTRFLPSGAQGRILYQTASGSRGELDRWSHLLVVAADGTQTCGEIEKRLAPRTRASDDPIARQERWIDLADNGLILLDPGDIC